MSPFIILTGVSACLKGWILWLGAKHKALSDFRWFFGYLVYAFAESVARVLVSNDRNLYLYVYWITEVLDVVLLAIAVGESFSRTLRPFAVFKGVRIAFWMSVATPVIYSIARSILQPPVQANMWAQVLIGVEITVSYLVIAVTVLYFVLVKLFDIQDNRYESGIILGFGINSGISACGYLVLSIFGRKSTALSTALPPLAFVLAEGLWVATFMKPPVPREEGPSISLTPDEIIMQLDEYLGILRRLFSKRWF